MKIKKRRKEWREQRKMREEKYGEKKQKLKIKKRQRKEWTEQKKMGKEIIRREETERKGK